MRKAGIAALLLITALLLSACGGGELACGNIYLISPCREKTATGSIYCWNCGKRISADSKYCSYCGAQVYAGNATTTDSDSAKASVTMDCHTSGSQSDYFSYSCDIPKVTISGKGKIAEDINAVFTEDEKDLYDVFCTRKDGDIRIERKATVERLDDQILSVLYDDYSELSWSAHGAKNYSGRTFDLATGKLMTLKSIAINEKKLKDTLLAIVTAECEENILAEICILSYGSESAFIESDSWVLDDEGLSFIAGGDSGSVLSEGPLIITLSYDELEGLIKAEYLPG